MALLMAALFLLAGGREAYGIGVCPHHGPGALHDGAAADHGEHGSPGDFARATVDGAPKGDSGPEGHGDRHVDDGGRAAPAPAHRAGQGIGHGHPIDSGLGVGDEAPAGHSEGCTCLGSCQGSAATVLPPTGGEAIHAPAAPLALSIIADGDRDLPGPPPHDHPFATAPPLTR